MLNGGVGTGIRERWHNGGLRPQQVLGRAMAPPAAPVGGPLPGVGPWADHRPRPAAREVGVRPQHGGNRAGETGRVCGRLRLSVLGFEKIQKRDGLGDSGPKEETRWLVES